jgi:alkanesulfonate monooxygenase SsuD/methylene tetrahydromethanopterin reductase-like flavin-dependent oxidoreductase (luciferase family)
MHVGYSVIFQGSADPAADGEVWRDEIALADRAEPLGFDSIWSVEHHFTSYTMCPDPLTFLSFMAGRTRQIKLGSMVVVLPWHDPIRVAEQVVMLDTMSGGRFVLGLGRGLGRVEFDGFRVPMGESRERFTESAQFLLQALETGVADFDGTHVHQPRRHLRPAPMLSFKGRVYASSVSPESWPIMARLGIGILIVPQKPWPTVVEELNGYRELYEQVNGEPAPAPLVAHWTFVDEDAGRARELGRHYLGGYYESVIDHYEFTAGHLSSTKGYEHYGKVGESIDKHGASSHIDFFADLQVYGTPAQCIDRIADIQRMTGAEGVMCVGRYADMTAAEGLRNQELFARSVMPAIRGLGPNPWFDSLRPAPSALTGAGAGSVTR